MKYSKILFSVLSVILLLFIANASFAQCAMCQATIESNLKAGGKTGMGLNGGIMYLMAVPYLVVVGVGLLWYLKYRKKSVELDIKSQKINLN